VLKAEPVPHLLVAGLGTNSFTTHYLVNPWKFGFDAALAKQFDGRASRCAAHGFIAIIR
jgi:hypothetical protein